MYVVFKFGAMVVVVSELLDVGQEVSAGFSSSASSRNGWAKKIIKSAYKSI